MELLDLVVCFVLYRQGYSTLLVLCSLYNDFVFNCFTKSILEQSTRLSLGRISGQEVSFLTKCFTKPVIVTGGILVTRFTKEVFAVVGSFGLSPIGNTLVSYSGIKFKGLNLTQRLSDIWSTTYVCI